MAGGERDEGPLLEVYVRPGCAGSARAMRVVQHIRERLPRERVNVIDLSREPGRYGHLVIATPTYVVRGRVFSLGNPLPEVLERALRQGRSGR